MSFFSFKWQYSTTTLFLIAFSTTLCHAQGTSSDSLQKQLARISLTAKGKTGIYASMIESGKSAALNGTQHFPMQSVYKLPIAMAVLDQVDKGKLKLNQQVRVQVSDFVSRKQHSPIRDQHPRGAQISLSELLYFAVSESDGTASDVLLRVVGGPSAVMAYLKALHLSDIKVVTTEKEMGANNKAQYQNWATPKEMVRLLQLLQSGKALSAASRAELLQSMITSSTGPHRIKGLLPKGTAVAHKTGTSGTVKGFTAATNDVGIVYLPNGNHLIVAVFVSDSPASEAVREGVIAKSVRATWDFWSGQQKSK